MRTITTRCTVRLCLGSGWRRIARWIRSPCIGEEKDNPKKEHDKEENSGCFMPEKDRDNDGKNENRSVYSQVRCIRNVFCHYSERIFQASKKETRNREGVDSKM